jgi:hypothetical protein
MVLKFSRSSPISVKAGDMLHGHDKRWSRSGEMRIAVPTAYEIRGLGCLVLVKVALLCKQRAASHSCWALASSPSSAAFVAI